MHNFIDKTNERLLLLKSKGFNPKNIVDIGANIGQFYKQIKKIFPESNVLSIEGNPNCESELKNTNTNYLIQLLGSKQSESTLYVNKYNNICTGASIYKESTEFYNDCNQINLVMNTLDSLNTKFDLIKIDVQGAELDILKGGLKTILDCEYLLIEVSVKKYNEGSYLIGDVVSYLNTIDFKIYDILNHFYFNNDLTQIDILFVNTNKNKNILNIY